ncbi:MAG: hypothetical protein Q9225_001453 [Loekoesia sp. 1 TL-2023]
MDGVSIAASLVAIGSAGCQIAIKLYTLATQISTASDRISSISNDVSLTSGVLQQLGELMAQKTTDDGTSIFSQGGLETTRTSAAMCENIFKEIEQAAEDASEQIRGRGRLVGKIKLSKFEKAKWPFLQPSIEGLRTDLREAKGTLMLMLQVTSLAFSKKIADLHQNASTHAVEQRDIIHAILELSKQARLEAPAVNSSTDDTPKPASPRGVKRKSLLLDEDSTLVQTPGSSLAALPSIRANTLMMQPEQKMPDQNPFRGVPVRSKKDQFDNLSSEDSTRNIQDKGCGASAVSKWSDYLRGGSLCAHAKFSIGDPNVGSKRLDGFTMKPVIQDLLDVIQLSWKIHKVHMEQADIQRQMIKNEQEGLPAVFETYQELYAHEHRALENQISHVGASATLISLKRTYTDMRHREILFKGVPGLQFVLMKEMKKEEKEKEKEKEEEEEEEGKIYKARLKDMYLAQGYGEERIDVMMKDTEKIKTGYRPRSPPSADVLETQDAINSKEKINKPALKLETSRAGQPVEGSQYLASLRRARFIRFMKDVSYPQGIVSPKASLRVDSFDDRLRYDIEFLVQFQTIIQQTPAQAVIHQLVVIPNEEAFQLNLPQYQGRSRDQVRRGSRDRLPNRSRSYLRRPRFQNYEHTSRSPSPYLDPEIEMTMCSSQALERKSSEEAARERVEQEMLLAESKKAAKNKEEELNRPVFADVQRESPEKAIGKSDEEVRRKHAIEKITDPMNVAFLTRPTYTKVHRTYTEPDTLDAYDLPWEWDNRDPSYLIIKCWVSESDQDRLFEHTRQLRKVRGNGELKEPNKGMRRLRIPYQLPPIRGHAEVEPMEAMSYAGAQGPGVPQIMHKRRRTQPQARAQLTSTPHYCKSLPPARTPEKPLHTGPAVPSKSFPHTAAATESMPPADRVSAQGIKPSFSLGISQVNGLTDAESEPNLAEEISDESEEMDEAFGESMNDEEAERVVKDLLGKYTTLFQP